eukprot:178338-Hanusia_phi.AAC.1
MAGPRGPAIKFTAWAETARWPADSPGQIRRSPRFLGGCLGFCCPGPPRVKTVCAGVDSPG